MARVLLTRPRAQSEAFARELAEDGIETLIWPVIEIVDVPYDPPPGDVQAVAFTSATAVRRLSTVLDTPAFCVGAATAKAARDVGFVDVVDAKSDAGELAAVIGQRLDPNDGPIWWPCGAHKAQDLAVLLPEFRVVVTPIYEAKPTGAPGADVIEAMNKGEIHAVALFSPRSAAIFASEIGGQNESEAYLSRMTGVAISENAAVPLAGLGLAGVVVADRPNRAAMHAAIRGAIA
ncbi:MAG: uroporphyrinogen-III synthase [Pikeienuella sp.]